VDKLTPTVLVVEDELRLRGLIRDYLEEDGIRVLEAGRGDEALDLFERERADLVVLDLMLPGMDGFEVCRRLRERTGAWIVMLTARSEEHDKLTGYDAGADDYVTKPFSPSVLRAKVRTLLKRSAASAGKDMAAEAGLQVDEGMREARLNGEALPLSPKEFDLLLCLCRNPNLVLSRDLILDRVWGFDYFGDVRTVDTHIKRLRRKLGEAGAAIETARGNGYRWRVKP